MRLISSESGLTLIELLAAMAIAATLSALAIPKLQDSIDRGKVAKAIQDISAIQADLTTYDAKDSLPASLSEIGWSGAVDPWGRPYQYFPFPPGPGGKGKSPPPGARRDRFLVPINSTYDLYSMGKDGATVPALTAEASWDDIVRAADGSYVGLGSKY
jgi:general secretion pathway protein G